MITEVIGNSVLHHGDCREFSGLVNPKFIMISDPPYGIYFKYEGDYQDNGGGDYIQLLEIFKNKQSILLQYPEETMRYFVPLLGVPDDCVAWCYNSNTNRQFRLWSFFGLKPDFNAYKVPAKNINDARVNPLVRSYDWFDDLQQVKNVSEEKTEHPCQISVRIMERIIALSARNEIMDPFMGSGSTGVAAVNLGKRFIGIEREQKYFDIACQRIEAAHKQTRLFA